MCILYYKQLWIKMIFKAKQNPNSTFGKSFFTWDYWEKGQTESHVLKVCLNKIELQNIQQKIIIEHNNQNVKFDFCMKGSNDKVLNNHN